MTNISSSPPLGHNPNGIDVPSGLSDRQKLQETSPPDQESHKQYAKELLTKIDQGYQPTEVEIAFLDKMGEDTSDFTVKSPEKGLLDYPKDWSLWVTKQAAVGTAKNQQQFFDDVEDIGYYGNKVGQNLKEGKIGKAGLNSLKTAGNVISAGWNMLQTAANSAVGGLSLITSVPLNFLDEKGEWLSEKVESDTIGPAIFGDKGSHKEFFEVMREGKAQGMNEANTQRHIEISLDPDPGRLNQTLNKTSGNLLD